MIKFNLSPYRLIVINLLGLTIFTIVIICCSESGVNLHFIVAIVTTAITICLASWIGCKAACLFPIGINMPKNELVWIYKKMPIKSIRTIKISNYLLFKYIVFIDKNGKKFNLIWDFRNKAEVFSYICDKIPNVEIPYKITEAVRKSLS